MLCCWWKNLGQPTCHSGHKMERNGYTCHTYVCVWVLFVVVYSVTTEWNPMNCSKPGLPLLYYKIPRSYNKWRAGEGKVSSGTKYSCHHALFSLEELCQPGQESAVTKEDRFIPFSSLGMAGFPERWIKPLGLLGDRVAYFVAKSRAARASPLNWTTPGLAELTTKGSI